MNRNGIVRVYIYIYMYKRDPCYPRKQKITTSRNETNYRILLKINIVNNDDRSYNIIELSEMTNFLSFPLLYCKRYITCNVLLYI